MNNFNRKPTTVAKHIIILHQVFGIRVLSSSSGNGSAGNTCPTSWLVYIYGYIPCAGHIITYKSCRSKISESKECMISYRPCNTILSTLSDDPFSMPAPMATILLLTPYPTSLTSWSRCISQHHIKQFGICTYKHA